MTVMSFCSFFCKHRGFMVNTWGPKVFAKLLFIRRNTCCCYWVGSKSVRMPPLHCLPAWGDSQPLQTSRWSPIAPGPSPGSVQLSECALQFPGKVTLLVDSIKGCLYRGVYSHWNSPAYFSLAFCASSRDSLAALSKPSIVVGDSAGTSNPRS